MKSTISSILAFLFTVYWIAGCSPEHTGEFNDSREQMEKALSADFLSIQTVLINTQCLKCHETATAKNHHIDLSSYQSIMQSNVFPPLITPGSPELSSFYLSISSGRMPKNSRSMSPVVIEKVYRWIASGAKESEGRSGEGDGGGNGDEDNDPLPPDCDPDEPGCGDEWE